MKSGRSSGGGQVRNQRPNACRQVGNRAGRWRSDEVGEVVRGRASQEQAERSKRSGRQDRKVQGGNDRPDVVVQVVGDLMQSVRSVTSCLFRSGLKTIIKYS